MRNLLPLVLITAGLIVGPVRQSAAQFAISSQVISGGGTDASGGSFVLKGTIGEPVIGPVSGGSFEAGQGFWYTVQAANVISFANLKVYMEGPYSGGGAMSTALNPNVPIHQPYDDANYVGLPLYYTGTDSVTSMPAGAVDWVEVELRTGSAATDSLTTRAGLLMSDGTIKDTDGTSLLAFPFVPDGSYFAVVRHRNHLAVMSAAAIAIGASPALYDFTTAQTQAFGASPMIALGDGSFGMIAADANANGQVQNDDKNLIWAVETGSAGYKRSDFDLNGQVQNTDKNLLWNPNSGLGTKVPE